MRAGSSGQGNANPLPYCCRRVDDPFWPLDSPAQVRPRGEDLTWLRVAAGRIGGALRRLRGGPRKRPTGNTRSA